jgi:two-component system NtrC family sensor kinase
MNWEMNEKDLKERPTVQKPYLSGKKCLLIDDDVQMINVLAKYFAVEGCYTEKALDGKSALEKMDTTRFDFILCDVRMPGMNGVTFYQELKKRKSPYLNKIIFITGETMSDEIQEFLNSIENPLLQKPFGLHDIREVIQGLLTNPSYGNKSIV